MTIIRSGDALRTTRPSSKPAPRTLSIGPSHVTWNGTALEFHLDEVTVPLPSRIRGRVRQRGVELPLIISDHCDWPELLQTIVETGAGEIWVTHGREDALVHELTKRGLTARALALVGREDEAE